MSEKRRLTADLRITAYITDTHAPMTHFVLCPVCGGAIAFNLAELEGRKAHGQSTSVYCAGRCVDPTSGLVDGTRGGGDPRNHYHPGFPPEPIFEFDWSEDPVKPA